MIAAAAFLPQQHMFAAAIKGARFGIVHHLSARGDGVKNMAAILKIISDDEVRMPVAIYIGKKASIRIPTLFTGNQFYSLEVLYRETALVSGTSSSAKKRNRSASPVIDHNV